MFEFDHAFRPLIKQVRKVSPGRYATEGSMRVQDFLSDKLTLNRLVDAGISKRSFDAIVEGSRFSNTQWSDLLGINVRTLQRHRSADAHILNLR